MLEPFLAWHRREELPQYIELLADVESVIDQTVSVEQVAGIYTDVEAGWLRLQDQSLTLMLDLGATLSDEQVAEFMAHLWERQEEYEEEYLGRSEKKFREESYDSLLDSLQDYLGRLDKGQRSRLREASAALQRSDTV